MKKVWHDKAWEEYLYWQTQDKKTLKKINRLLTDIDRNGYNCAGKLEPLKSNLSGYWSVRIDEQNRIVFKINGEQLEILQCGSHYGDK
ncbi:MAG: Txe/YoeB family addiction module toxin [Ruminococcus sp.]|nr:Txe/YoeB family addiction module toxin [Ruminococcus sp.]